jgi:sugar phosphate isomerase/epimerase
LTQMDIGICLKYDLLDRYFEIYNVSGILPKHLQINGLPARVSSASASINESIGKLRAANPCLQVSLHAYKFNLCETVKEVRDIWVDLAKDTLRMAADLGAAFVNFHAGYGMGGSRTRHGAYREALVPTLRLLADFADAAGVGMHIENLYPRPLRSEYTMLGDRVSDFDRFFEAVGSPHFQLCYDYGHGNIDEYGIEVLRRHIGRLGSVHAHDNDQQSDIHLPVLSKHGTINWKNEIGFLTQAGFNGPFILEGPLKSQLESLRNLADAGLIDDCEHAERGAMMMLGSPPP